MLIELAQGRLSHWLLSPCYKEASLPSTEQYYRKQKGGWDVNTLHGVLCTPRRSLLKAGASPAAHSNGLHREAGPG